MDQRSGRADEPDDLGRDGQTLLLRDPRPAARAPRQLCRGLQLRQAAQDPQRPHTLRIHLQMLDKRASAVHIKPAPSNSGTKHLAECWPRLLGLTPKPPPFTRILYSAFLSVFGWWSRPALPTKSLPKPLHTLRTLYPVFRLFCVGEHSTGTMHNIRHFRIWVHIEPFCLVG